MSGGVAAQLREKAICGRLLDNEPVPMKGCDFNCDSCEVKKQVSHYVYLGHALAVLATQQHTIKDHIIRLMQIRAGSIFDNHFEAGIIYTHLNSLGWIPPKWRKREEVAQWITDVVHCAHTSDEAKKKLNQVLGGGVEATTP